MNKTTIIPSPVTSGAGESQRYPLDAFRFCPRCGHDHLNTGQERAVRCGVCGFLFFFNTAAASAAFLFHGDQLILCVRAREPGRDKLDLPGGFIEYDETVEQGLRREIREELNLETGQLDYLCSAPNDYLYAGVLYKVTDLFFTGVVEDIGSIKPADDVGGYRLAKPEAIDPAGFAFHSTRTAFQYLLSRPPVFHHATHPHSRHSVSAEL
ncbi:NUDIX domain-containing protein [Candidatus Woesearchaeota archaeon]|nr:NUDIX domain-containing protein [Candidatus Woesearchaeota archaeon]